MVEQTRERHSPRKDEALRHIMALPRGTELWAYKLTSDIVNPRDRKRETNYRQFLKKFLEDLANAENPIIRFVGWKDSNAPLQKKVYKRL